MKVLRKGEVRKDQALRLYLTVPGILLALAGFTFTLQGLGMVGPTSSFMFQSNTWVIQGVAVFFVGILLVLGGIWLGRPKKSG